MTTRETGSITFGRTTIPYLIERSERRSTVSIAVDGARGVIVRAPAATDPLMIETIVTRKAPWILRRLADFDEIGSSLNVKEFVSGESFLYLGRGYRLKVVSTEYQRPTIVLQSGRLIVTIPITLEDEQRRESVRAALVNWYSGQAKQRLPERVQIYVRKLGQPLPPVFIRDQEKRWGSCSAKGELRFNWRVVMAPMPLVDYVVAHEACHLVIPEHSAGFWNLLQSVVPDYEVRRERLRLIGNQLQI